MSENSLETQQREDNLWNEQCVFDYPIMPKIFIELKKLFFFNFTFFFKWHPWEKRKIQFLFQHSLSEYLFNLFQFVSLFVLLFFVILPTALKNSWQNLRFSDTKKQFLWNVNWKGNYRSRSEIHTLFVYEINCKIKQSVKIFWIFWQKVKNCFQLNSWI